MEIVFYIVNTKYRFGISSWQINIRSRRRCWSIRWFLSPPPPSSLPDFILTFFFFSSSFFFLRLNVEWVNKRGRQKRSLSLISLSIASALYWGNFCLFLQRMLPCFPLLFLQQDLFSLPPPTHNVFSYHLSFFSPSLLHPLFSLFLFQKSSSWKRSQKLSLGEIDSCGGDDY